MTRKLLYTVAFCCLCIQESKASDILGQAVLNRTLESREFSGEFFQHLGFTDGLFCTKESYYYGKWNALLKEAKIVMKDQKDLHVILNFDKSHLTIGGQKKGGMFCGWLGGESEIDLKSVYAEIRLVSGQETHPEVDVSGLKIEGLKFKKLQIKAPGFKAWQGDAPIWLSGLVQNNINKWIASFIASSWGQKLDGYLSDKLREYLNRLPVDDLSIPQTAVP